jgi:EAL domain-containing protein (putative c-di-GMP-specific phosphodiesterase class I)
LRFFGQPADAPVEQRSALAMALQAALGEDRLALQLQPPLRHTDPATASPSFHLAVAGWTDPHGHAWPEDALSELAQASGLGHALDQWRLTRACQSAAQAGQRVVVAVSAAYLLGQRAVRDVQRTLQTTGLPAHHLCLSLPMALHGQLSLPTEQALGELQALGVSVGLCHAGDHGLDPKGLRAVAPHHIALSPRVLPTPPEEVSAQGSPLAVWLAMGQALGVDIWATGVTDPTTAKVLLAAGCRAVYGPMPAAA